MPYEPTNGQTNAEQGGHERTTGPAATRVVKVVNHTLEIAPSMAASARTSTCGGGRGAERS